MVSNISAIGVGDFASLVHVPERRLKIGVSWSGDHRVVERAELAAFVKCWRE